MPYPNPWTLVALALLLPCCLRQPVRRQSSTASSAPAERQPPCWMPAPAVGTPVARVGNVVITAEQLEAHLLAEQAGQHPTEHMAVLCDLLDDHVRFELLAQAALVHHLDRDADVIDAARRVMVRKLLEQDLEYSDTNQATAEATARAYYDKYRDHYALPEKRRFSQIELPHTAAGRAQAVNLIERMRRHHDLRETFAAMAQKFSRDVTTRNHGGEVPFSTAEEIVQNFGSGVAAAVFAQDPNTIPTVLVPEPIESRQGWLVLYVAARRQAMVRDFSEVRDAIHARLAASGREAKFQTYMNGLRKTCPVAIYDGPLEEIVARWKAHDGSLKR